MDYKVYQGIENPRKAYVAVSAEIEPCIHATRLANKHFKTNLYSLRVEAGYVIGNNLYIGYSDDKKAEPVWVITRK